MREEVEHGLVLQPEGVDHVQRKVGEDRDHGAGRPEPAGKQYAIADDKQADGLTLRDDAGGERPGVTLVRVDAVALDVLEVVQDIGCRGGHTEQRKGDQRVGNGGRVRELAGEDQRRQHESVLYPLLRAYQPDEPDDRHRFCWRDHSRMMVILAGGRCEKANRCGLRSSTRSSP